MNILQFLPAVFNNSFILNHLIESAWSKVKSRKFVFWLKFAHYELIATPLTVLTEEPFYSLLSIKATRLLNNRPQSESHWWVLLRRPGWLQFKVKWYLVPRCEEAFVFCVQRVSQQLLHVLFITFKTDATHYS